MNLNVLNFSEVFDLLTEIEYWTLIGFASTLKPNYIVKNTKKIKYLYRNTSKIVKDYNILIAGILYLINFSLEIGTSLWLDKYYLFLHYTHKFVSIFKIIKTNFSF